ncbi:MAG: polysaccharide deacetylase family protein [Myxococcales bacterium]|nr:polysaccharide deacetylase family protein [Myxococcales bacterium]MCB9734277.1 polysaccharide deacetylase family protein [Deltaproteobacteria bacterium]
MASPGALRAAAVNVDVDSLYLYYRIHGLDEARATDVVWERGVVRFAELFAELGVAATFFVVAQDLDRPGPRRVAEALAQAGHELGSHSHTHPYDLTRLGRATMADELARAEDAISAVSGRPVRGFRAPGYTVTRELLELLAERGYAYDSSLFPAPPYYLAKAAYMAWLRVRGRKSQSILDRPSIMWQRRTPHRRHGLLEIPVTVLPWLRLHVIGTSLLQLGERGYGVIAPWLRRVDLVNLELHGIDLCDLAEDGIDPALRTQPDLRVDLATKLALFRRVFTDLRDGWGVDTLESLSGRLAASAA